MPAPLKSHIYRDGTRFYDRDTDECIVDCYCRPRASTTYGVGKRARLIFALSHPELHEAKGKWYRGCRLMCIHRGKAERWFVYDLQGKRRSVIGWRTMAQAKASVDRIIESSSVFTISTNGE